MQRDFDSAPEAPEWPEGIAVRTFVRGQDEEATFAVRQEAYADMWDFDSAPFSVWKHHLIDANPDFDPALWFLALDGEEVVGMTLCDARTSEDAEMGWVKSVGVRRNWRRRGIAAALLRHAFAEFYRRGTRKVALTVDAESLTGALRLYERAGMRVVRRQEIYEKMLPHQAGGETGDFFSTATTDTPCNALK
jgi:ribosomal protein S18 acetylase RimI-like enzyme